MRRDVYDVSITPNTLKPPIHKDIITLPPTKFKPFCEKMFAFLQCFIHAKITVKNN